MRSHSGSGRRSWLISDWPRPFARWLVGFRERRAFASGFWKEIWHSDPGKKIELAAFRIAQEALSNAIKHAQATLITVSLRQIDDWLVLSVTDNGVGFEPALIDSSSRPRLGLQGMRERAELVGGSLDVRSRPDSGSSVRAQLPISEVAS